MHFCQNSFLSVPALKQGCFLCQAHAVSTIAYLMEGFGYGCAGNCLAFGLGTQIWGIQSTLLKFGTDTQLAKYVPGSVAGKLIGAYAMNEDCSGSDAFGISATAMAEPVQH